MALVRRDVNTSGSQPWWLGVGRIDMDAVEDEQALKARLYEDFGAGRYQVQPQPIRENRGRRIEVVVEEDDEGGR